MTTKPQINVIDWIICISKMLGLKAETVFRAISIYKIQGGDELKALASIIVASTSEDKTISVHKLKRIININFSTLDISKEVSRLADYTIPATCYDIFKELTGKCSEWDNICYYMLTLKFSNLTDEVIAHLATARYENRKPRYKEINKILLRNIDKKFIGKLSETQLKFPKMSKI